MQSPRLTYRELQPDDARRIAQLAGDWDVARMTTRVPYPYLPQDARSWMDNIPEHEVVWCILLDDEFIGAVGYTELDTKSAEIGYWIGRPWWGHGFATEAATTVVRHCHETVGYEVLTCCHFQDNPASARIISKLGFQPNGQCSAWSEARQENVATCTYERRRSLLSTARFLAPRLLKGTSREKRICQ